MYGVLKMQDRDGRPVDLAVLNVGTSADPVWALVTAGQGGSSGGGSQRDVTLTTVTGVGSVDAGAVSVSITNTGDVTGSVMGVAFPAGASYALQVDGGDTLEAITYDATGTSFVLSVIR